MRAHLRFLVPDVAALAVSAGLHVRTHLHLCGRGTLLDGQNASDFPGADLQVRTVFADCLDCLDCLDCFDSPDCPDCAFTRVVTVWASDCLDGLLTALW